MNHLATVVALLLLLISQPFAHAFKPEIGETPAPLEKLEYVDGSVFDVASLIGKPTVLYFGADWCVPCIERGRPAAVATANKYGPLGLQVIFVSMDDNRFRAAKVLESNSLGMRIAMARMDICPPGKCLNGIRDLGAFGRIYVYPTAIVLDANGVVRAKMDRGMGVAAGLDTAAKEVMRSAGLLTNR